MKVLCFSSIEFSAKCLHEVLSAGVEVEWGTAITVEEVKLLEPFYDFVVMSGDVKFHSKKCTSIQKLKNQNKGDLS